MNYVYDLTLNFNDEYISYYEWNENDNIKLYDKIPIIKVQDDIIDDFIKNKIIIDLNFMTKIKPFNILILTSTNLSIGIMINKDGLVIKRSSISLDEEEDILSFSKIIKYTLFDYKIIKKEKNKDLFLTRTEKNIKQNLLKKINDYYDNNEYEKLKYIYYELYDEKNSEVSSLYSKIINVIDNNSFKIKRLNDILYQIENNGTFVK